MSMKVPAGLCRECLSKTGSLRRKWCDLHRPAKYRSKRTEAGGIVFQSRKEARRHGHLLLMQQQGFISGLQTQVPYGLTVNEVFICRYYADFVYQEDGQTVVEDAKGVRTRDYRIKARLMLAVHGIRIRET